jgi:hypothetical protein
LQALSPFVEQDAGARNSPKLKQQWAAHSRHLQSNPERARGEEGIFRVSCEARESVSSNEKILSVDNPATLFYKRLVTVFQPKSANFLRAISALSM